jgi:starch phosphorylase
LIDTLLNRDTYLLLADFGDYLAAQDRVDVLYRNPEAWAELAILNIAGMGRFSSDRTIREYARTIWGMPCPE